MLTVAQLVKKFSAFMEPESALGYSQEPATGPYPNKPDEFSLCRRSSDFCKIHFNITLSFTPKYIFLVVSLCNFLQQSATFSSSDPNVLKYFQSMFFLWCKRRSFTQTRNNIAPYPYHRPTRCAIVLTKKHIIIPSVLSFGLHLWPVTWLVSA
jgi:hypothetical protein